MKKACLVIFLLALCCFCTMSILIGGFLVVAPFQINGASMEPGFVSGEIYLVNKMDKTLGFGDVVIYQKNATRLIGRVMARNYDTIELSNGDLLVNSSGHLFESYLKPGSKTNVGSYFKEGQSYTVPADNYLILGDNRENSYDSRYFGYVSSGLIEGKILFRIR